MIDTKWFIVVNTPGVDIRHKFEGQELILVENVNYQVANQIVREHNAHKELETRAFSLLKTLRDNNWVADDGRDLETLEELVNNMDALSEILNKTEVPA